MRFVNLPSTKSWIAPSLAAFLVLSSVCSGNAQTLPFPLFGQSPAATADPPSSNTTPDKTEGDTPETKTGGDPVGKGTGSSADGGPPPPAAVSVDAADDTLPQIKSEDVKSLLDTVEANSDASDDQKATQRESLQSVSDSLKQLNEFTASATKYLGSVETAPKSTEKNQKELAALRESELELPIEKGADSDTTRKSLDSQKATLRSMQDELARINAALLETAAQPIEIGNRLPAAQRELSEVRNQWDTLGPEDPSASVEKKIARMVTQANALRLDAELRKLRQEQASQSAREKELESRRDLLAEKLRRRQSVIKKLSAMLEVELGSDATRIRALAKAASADAAGDPKVQKLIDEVNALADEFELVVPLSGRVESQATKLALRSRDVNTEYQEVRSELALGSGGGELAQVLMELSRRARPDAIRVESPMSIEASRLAWFNVRRQRREQSGLSNQYENHPSPAVRKLVEARGEILEKYQAESAELTQALTNLRTNQQRFSDLCEEIQAYIGESLFGFTIRTCAPVSMETLTDAPDGLRWLWRPSHFQDVAQCYLEKSILSVLVALLMLFCWGLRHPMGKWLEATGPPTRRISTDRFAWTARAFVLTILLAAPVPLLVGLTAIVLMDSSVSGDWVYSLAQGFKRSIGLSCITAFLIESCRSTGLGPVHFHWDPAFARRLAKVLRRIVWVYLPLMISLISLSYGEGFAYFDDIGRMMFFAAHVWMILVFLRILRRTEKEDVVKQGESVSRMRKFWRTFRTPFMIGTPIALMISAAYGFMMTAIDVSIGLWVSGGIVAFGQIAYDTTIRWFEIRRRRLAFTEALEERRARQAASAEASDDNKSQEILHLDEEIESRLDLASAGDQAVAIFRLIFNLLILTVIYNYWSTVIPLASALDTVSIPLTNELSLLNLIQAIMIGIVAMVVVRNLPGLLEFFVLRRSDVEAGTRNAIYTLCQYAVIGIAAIAISNSMALDWAKLGWMAAALSVGLGFGLQEVVANFVCGLIVLFERPIRVGDVVTIEGTTGTVSNINMRATTIRNYDRQDLVVPNKNLVTGTILNWTLSATLNRLMLNIGVAYGTDIEKARQILLDVAADHPGVLDDPSPVATFEQFADSSMNLVLRCYLPSLDNRLSTTTDLNIEIAKRFESVGIEIPFPQQDFHLRSGWEHLADADKRVGSSDEDGGR